LKAKRAVIIVDVAESFTTALAQIFEGGFKLAGGKVEETYSIRTNDTNFEHIVKSLKERKTPDVIFMATSAMEAGFLLSQLASSGSRIPVLGCDGWQNSDLGRALKSLEQTHVNALFTAHWHLDFPRKESKGYIKNYEATYHEPLSSYDADAVLTYDAATLLLTAIRKANSSDPDKIMAALKTTTIEGATGQIRLGPNGEAIKDVGVLRITNGKLMPYRTEQ
jgi:branched-chain amino acid transport system substrate-binding protein